MTAASHTETVTSLAAHHGWVTTPLKFVFRRSKRLGDGSEQLLSIYRDYGVIPKDSRSDNFNKASEDLSKYQKVDAGDLVVNKMKAWQGSVAISDHAGIISPAYFVYRPTLAADMNTRYLHYLLRSGLYFQHYGSISTGVRPNQWDLDPAAFERTLLLQPPTAEQGAIADYLDHETAEIDAAISDQRTLIGLLEERQRIHKYRLVTGQTLSMPRFAEVARFWGKLPLDWSLQKLQWHFEIGNGSTPSTNTARFWDQDGFPWLNSSVVNEPSVLHPSRRVSHVALDELHLPIVRPGSLLMGITGQGKTRGMVTVLDIEATINQHLAYITPRSVHGPISVEYLRLALDVAYPELRQLSDGNGGTKGALTCHMLQQFKVPAPPRGLQSTLVAEARHETASTAEAVRDAELFIALARERRAALITAAVTGQIDVTARNKPAAEQLEDEIAQGLHREN